MNLFTNNNNTTPRPRRPRHPRPDDSTATPPPQPRRQHQVYADPVYAYDGTFEPVQNFLDPPLTPPPPYDALGTGHIPPMPTATFYQQPAQSQQCLPTQREPKLRKKASAWASTTDLAKLPRERMHRGEQGRQSNTNLIPRSGRVRFEDCPIVSTMCQSAALCDRAAAAFHDALSRLDREAEDEDYDDLVDRTRGLLLESDKPLERTRGGTIIDFKKTWMYANSRLPPYMPPMKIYLPTWQIICSAAQASIDVYRRPRKNEKQDYIDANWREGTKAMVIQSRPVDDKNLIVIAIRGSRWNVMDWAVNFRPAPSEPIGFLDDEGNACHAGFLQVARAMISPIAARLRDMLQQNPSRASSSLLFTGHSAGGAVASLLHMHMMATSVESELNLLTGCFKRVHCITFGTPPLSLLPLQNPAGRRLDRNVFMAFANEGDPVVRADRQYLSTLTRIIAAPSPASSSNGPPHGLRKCLSRQTLKVAGQAAGRIMPVRWEVPPATLSNAGRMVLLREKPGNHRSVEAVQCTDEELRDVIFGDLEMHYMEVYKRRIDDLAIAAVTGRGPV